MFRKIFLYTLTLCCFFSFFVLPVANASNNTYRATSSVGNAYELVIESETTEVMKPLPVTITLLSQDGSPISGANITCSLTMPAMAMPSNKPPIKESSNAGQYEGVLLLTMGGLWHVDLLTVYGSGEQDSVVISIPGVISEQSGDNVDAKLEALFQEQGETEKK